MTLYQQAKKIVQANRSWSLSLLQRELQCGYGVAARLIARMQAKGVTL